MKIEFIEIMYKGTEFM